MPFIEQQDGNLIFSSQFWGVSVANFFNGLQYADNEIKGQVNQLILGVRTDFPSIDIYPIQFGDGTYEIRFARRPLGDNQAANESVVLLLRVVGPQAAKNITVTALPGGAALPINEASQCIAHIQGRNFWANLKGQGPPGHNPFQYLNQQGNNEGNAVLPQEDLMSDNIINLESASLNTILYGPPGTGKTHIAIEMALSILMEKDQNLKNEVDIDKSRQAQKKLYDKYSGQTEGVVDTPQIGFVTFHQSYSYEDFVIGLKPKLEGGAINYVAEEGIFMQMCARASSSPDKNFVLIIDEINRGNLSSIFGELMTLIEESKREGKDECIKLRLPHREKLFGVPKNLYILGTMNTADRSAALIDIALRRRFEFIYMPPKFDLLQEINFGEGDQVFSLRSLMDTINKKIEILRDRDHIIGHASFMSLIKEENKKRPLALQKIFENRVIPLLEEYFYEDWKDIREVLGSSFIQESISEQEIRKLVHINGIRNPVYKLNDEILKPTRVNAFIEALRRILMPNGEQ